MTWMCLDPARPVDAVSVAPTWEPCAPKELLQPRAAGGVLAWLAKNPHMGEAIFSY